MTAPGWRDSEAWAFDLRARHYSQRGDADPQDELRHWQGSQKGAVLLAVLHLLATRLGGLAPAWELRRWLGRGEDLDIDGLIVRVTAHFAELAAMTCADDPDVARMMCAWQSLVRVEAKAGIFSFQPGIIVAAAHGRWLLDAQLAVERGGLPPHTPVRLLAEPASGVQARVHTAYWMDDDGPPVGYVLKLDDCGVVSVRAEMVAAGPADGHDGDGGGRPDRNPRPATHVRHLATRVLCWLLSARRRP